jgi:hypothetical protein
MTPFLKYLLTWTAGCLMGGGFVFAVAKPALDHGLASVTQLSDQVQDIYSQGTVLCEPNVPKPGAFIRELVGIPDPPSKEPCSARWYIPMKAKPVVYGDAYGVQVFYVDVKTKAWDGPHAPMVLPQ